MGRSVQLWEIKIIATIIIITICIISTLWWTFLSSFLYWLWVLWTLSHFNSSWFLEICIAIWRLSRILIDHLLLWILLLLLLLMLLMMVLNSRFRTRRKWLFFSTISISNFLKLNIRYKYIIDMNFIKFYFVQICCIKFICFQSRTLIWVSLSPLIIDAILNKVSNKKYLNIPN